MSTEDTFDRVLFYRLRPDEDRAFVCGVNRNQELVVIGVHNRGLVGVFFQRSGDFLRVEERGQSSEEVAQLGRRDALVALWSHLDNWKAEMGFKPCDIRVKAFFLSDLDIGIDRFPESEQAAIDAARTLLDPTTGEPVTVSFSENENRHCFIFWWGMEYWMNALGEVTDT